LDVLKVSDQDMHEGRQPGSATRDA
jgi:hypothetical protein